MKILFVQTGGTIDKDYPVKRGSYHFEIDGPAFEQILHKVLVNFNYETISVTKKDSLDLDESDREKIYDACKSTEIDRIIITHGTDTIVQTAQVLSKITDKVIILTGSILPWTFKQTDAEFNLGVAVGAISHLKNGIYVAMSGIVYKWDEVEKNDLGNRFVYKEKSLNANT